MTTHLLSIVVYVIATFATQAFSHFALNAEHYAAIPHLRQDVIFPLGIASMLIQGAVLSYLYANTAGAGRSTLHALKFAWAAGAILVSYIALGEAGKYLLPDIGAWIRVEFAAGFVQFTLYGLLLGVVHRGAHRAPSLAKA